MSLEEQTIGMMGDMTEEQFSHFYKRIKTYKMFYQVVSHLVIDRPSLNHMVIAIESILQGWYVDTHSISQYYPYKVVHYVVQILGTNMVLLVCALVLIVPCNDLNCPKMRFYLKSHFNGILPSLMVIVKNWYFVK